MNQQLDIKRMGYLGRRDMINRWRNLAVSAGAVSGVMILLVLLQILFQKRVSMDYGAYFLGALIVWGCIDASISFLSLHDKSANEAFLLLPASALEKTLVRLLFTSLVLPFFILILIFIASMISEGAGALFVKESFTPMQLFGAGHLKTIGYVVIAQSIFFLGAAWFKKAHLVKTVFALIVGSIGLGILSTILFRIIFASYFEGFFMPISVNIDMEALLRMRFPGLMDAMVIIGKVAFYGLLAPFCWFVAWLRVKETQSSDGI